MILSLVASYWQHSWRGLSLFVTVLGLPFLLLQKWLVESPRWVAGDTEQQSYFR